MIQEPDALPVWLEPLCERVNQSVGQGRLPHGVLIVGGAGFGAEPFLDWLQRRMLCSSEAVAPCGECRACRLVAAGNHSDCRILVPEGKGRQIRIESVRDLIAFSQGTPRISQRKVGIIVQADRLNASSANALLKVLEEPPANTVLALSTDRPQQLLPTVRSRLQVWHLPRPSVAEARDWLLARGVPGQAAEVLIRLHEGAPWSALESYETGLMEARDTALESLNHQLSRPEPYLRGAEMLAALEPAQVLPVWRQWSRELLQAALTIDGKGALSLQMPDYRDWRHRLTVQYSDPVFWVAVHDLIESLHADWRAGNHFNWRSLLDVFWVRLGRLVQKEQKKQSGKR